MKIISSQSLYARNSYIVQLDDDDLKRTDHEMITAVDNYGEYNKPCHHFGGTVEPLADGTVRIDVYID
jgi:hypothetical protein